jgi:hypothetical protein
MAGATTGLGAAATGLAGAGRTGAGCADTTDERASDDATRTRNRRNGINVTGSKGMKGYE